MKSTKKICIVAMLRDELRFIDEWLIYHRLIGIDHFYLYDDDPSQPLLDHLKEYNSFVTVIPWYSNQLRIGGRNRQIQAYLHAVKEFSSAYDWITFIDGDEFIALKKHSDIKTFLNSFKKCSAICLQWHVFGHNGFYDDPTGLITECLTRRNKEPRTMIKSITRCSDIVDILSVHSCVLKDNSVRVDANGKKFIKDIYPGKTAIAHINHYQCRSFLTWMKRAEIGNPHDGEMDQLWRRNADDCLRKFVTKIAVDWNEFSDIHMLQYSDLIKEEFIMKKIS